MKLEKMHGRKRLEYGACKLAARAGQRGEIFSWPKSQ